MNLSWSFFFSDIDGVLKSANGTEYGLASGVFTKDLSKVWFNFFKASICFQLLYYSFLVKKDMCSGIFHNIHSCKWTALLTAGCLHNTQFFFNSRTNAVFLHSHKWPAPVTDTIIMSWALRLFTHQSLQCTSNL